MSGSSLGRLQQLGLAEARERDGKTYYLVVVGYAEAEGSYTLDVQCICN
jgi:hypothetical protein